MVASSGCGNCDVDKVTFVEEPLDTNHECLVCLQLSREPWIVECCGHHMCKQCIDKLVCDRQGCPHCRTPRFRHMRDRNHERILLGKQVYCKYRIIVWSHWYNVPINVKPHYPPCGRCRGIYRGISPENSPRGYGISNQDIPWSACMCACVHTGWWFWRT